MAYEKTGLIGWLKSRSGLVFLGFAAITLFFLWHEAHILRGLPQRPVCLFAHSRACFMAGMEIMEIR